MEEKSPVPQPKTRLIFSFVVLIAGLITLYGVEPFDNQVTIGWVVTGVGIVSVIYNMWCLKTGRMM